MLTSLKINDIAIIDEARIQFDKGFNVMTGETGSGKSIIIDSLGAVIGERTSRELIREDAPEGRVTAVFDCVSNESISVLEKYKIEYTDDSLMIERIIRDGRSICRINGESVNASVLRELGQTLVNIHGQNDSYSLSDSRTHLSYIDSVADNLQIRKEYEKCYNELKAINKKLKKLSMDESEKERKIESLRFQIDEIESADIKIGEKNELEAQKKRILNFEKIHDMLISSENLLEGDDNSNGIISSIYALLSNLEPLSECYDSLAAYPSKISDSVFAFKDLLSDISKEISSFSDIKITDINIIEERLDLIFRLSKKYGKTEEEIILYLENAKKEYSELALNDDMIKELTDEYNSVLEKLISIGRELTETRKRAGEEFSKRITAELKFLDMNEAVFNVSFKESAVTSKGLDEVEFLISTNAGQSEKPLSKIASGGELSRIMLAIKCVLSENDKEKTLVFDEIDSGVSGRAAEKIGIKLKEISKYSQVLCVTHLAQIASFAHNHLYIEKASDGSKTLTKVRTLDENDRKLELARIIGGSLITKSTLMSAEEMISMARKY